MSVSKSPSQLTAHRKPVNMPTFSVVVTCYNYRAYVAEAVASALCQTLAPIEVIVVDDGSSDGSAEHLAERFGTDPRVRLIGQANAGPAIASRTGVAAARGELVAFLDADDLWEPTYLDTVAKVYARLPEVDYVYANMRYFGEREGLYLAEPTDRDHGLSILLGCYRPSWQSSANSAITLRSALARRLLLDLPEPMLQECRAHNDDFLSLGANILGGHKYYLAEPLVRYRSHGANLWLARDSGQADRLKRWLNIERIVGHYAQRAGLDPARRAEQLCFVKHEFLTKPAPRYGDLRAYWGLLRWSNLPWAKRWEHRLSMLAHYVRSRARQRRGSAAADTSS